ncbi:MAG: carboxypeptidase-like regulatory domain-containing protein [Thermoguttaceae bacterium]
MSQRDASSFSAASASVVSEEPLVSKEPLWRFAVAALVCLTLLAITGCGGSGDRPTLGRVHGRVTMDGQPLARAGIGFQPKARGRESYARTNANGEYELSYLREVKGAGIGENSVRVTTQRTNDPETETVPAKYNRQTTLHFEVKPGDNEANFDLTSDEK